MSISPINPQDHKIRGHADYSDRDEETAALEWAGWKLDALAEAIHQTFERDVLPRICANCGNEYRTGFGVGDDEGLGGACCQMPVKCDGKSCKMARDECDHYYAADPDTEIDRMARLIVDGEYRRRAGSNG